MQCYVTYLNMRQGEFLPGDNIVSVSVIASFTSSKPHDFHSSEKLRW